MKAIVWTKYGPPEGLQLKEVEKPVPEGNQVLIRIHATTVTAGDSELRRFGRFTMFWLPMRLYFGLFRPRKQVILGQELAGIVEAVGEAVTRFQPGDRVFAAVGFNLGTWAEYKCLPENAVLAKMPDGLSFNEAATIPVEGLEALDFLRQGVIQPGEKVLIVGAGGSIGTIAIQLAKMAGAEVTGVDRAEKLALIGSLGADYAIDHRQTDFTRTGERYDVIFDVIGVSPFSPSLRTLKANGRYLLGNAGLVQRLRAKWVNRRGGKKIVLGARQRREDLVHLGELVAVGKIKTIIDRHYPLEQTAEAHRYVESGAKMGNVVITIG